MSRLIIAILLGIQGAFNVYLFEASQEGWQEQLLIVDAFNQHVKDVCGVEDEEDTGIYRRIPEDGDELLAMTMHAEYHSDFD